MPKRTAKQRKKQKKAAIALLAVLVMAALGAVMAAYPPFFGWLNRAAGITPVQAVPGAGAAGETAVHFIDVGQGDAVLLCVNGAFALMDAGPLEAADTLVAYLEDAGVKRLDYVFMTHPHADHIGGMRAVVQRFEVEKMVLPDFSLAPLPTTSTFEKLLEALVEQNVPSETARLAAEYPLGGGVVRVVHAGLKTDDNYNFLSLGLMFTAGDMRFLNTGDGEKANERAMLESGEDLRADVFMAGHHGSGVTSNTSAFVRAVSPTAVVVSCGVNNSYGHPHAGALEVFEQAGARVLRTDRNGHVVVRPDGGGGLLYATAATDAALSRAA